MRTVAWAAPTVMVATAAPAFALSSPPNIVNNGAPLAVTRCGTTADGAIGFTAFEGTSPASEGEAVTIHLPEGLLFTDGSSTKTVETGTEGVVNVPAFRALGAAGSYPIQARFGNEQFGFVDAFATVEVEADPGKIFQLVRSSGTGTPRFTTTDKNIPNGQRGSITGNLSGASAAVVAESGQGARALYWGEHLGGSTPTPLKYPPAGADVTGMKFVHTWTSTSGATSSAGGVAAGSTGAAVYQWHRASNTHRVFKVQGITGDVLAVQSNNTYSYVLTTAGLHYWANATTGGTSGSPTVSAKAVANTAGATEMSTWGKTTSAYGGGLLQNGAIKLWNGNHTLSTPSAAPKTVHELLVVEGAQYALTEDGGLYTAGSAFGRANGGTGWVRRRDDVTAVDAWGVNNYTGGVAILSTGAVVQFFAAAQESRGWMTETHDSFGNRTVTQVFASDGTYLALTSDARGYAWGGNLDNSASQRTTPADTNIENAMDLEVWGFHNGAASYSGGGYIIAGQGC